MPETVSIPWNQLEPAPEYPQLSGCLAYLTSFDEDKSDHAACLPVYIGGYIRYSDTTKYYSYVTEDGKVGETTWGVFRPR